jgi:hypothetical protein
MEWMRCIESPRKEAGTNPGSPFPKTNINRIIVPVHVKPAKGNDFDQALLQVGVLSF